MTLGKRSLPAAYALCRDLEQLAYQADQELVERGAKAKHLEEAARTINGIFGKCLNDRWGFLWVVRLIFSVVPANNSKCQTPQVTARQDPPLGHLPHHDHPL